MSAVETFEVIIRHQSAKELVPFLVGLPKTDTVAVRQKCKSLQRELDTFKEHTPDSWSSLITHEQRFMLLLTGLKVFSRKEALGPNFLIWNYALDAPYAALFWAVLDEARPDWLGDMLAQHAASKTNGTPDYLMLREMERRQLIAHQDALFAASAAELLSALGNQLSQHPPVPANAADVIAQQLRADDLFIRRDLPLVFDYDTVMDSSQAYVQLRMPMDRSKLNWQTWDKAHPRQVVSWLEVLVRLVDSGTLARAEVLSRGLLALRRDFRRPLLAWFKNLCLALKPTVAEQLEYQANVFELLAHPQAQVINFALDQCKRLWTEAAFDASGLLLYAEGLVTRQDLKTGLRTLLGGFEKLLKRDPALAPQIARLSALALANADAAVQEKAAKVLVAVLTATKALLSETEQADVQEVIGLYTDLLAPGARTALQAWLPEPRALSVARENGSGAYCPKAEFAPTLSASSAFRPVQDWHELLFLTGQLVQHDDPMVMERWVDGLLRLQSQFPAGYAAQLQPYLVQMLPFLKGKSDAQAAAIIAAHSQSGHFGLVQALLLSWAEGLRSARVPRVNLKDAYYASDPLVRVEQQRLAAAEERLTQRIGLALLSTPSHAPHWVSPAVLVEKLLAHQAQQVLPNAADLAVALARTAFAHRGEGERALALLPQLQHAELRELLTWFLAPQEGALPLKAGVKKSLVRHLTERLGKLVSSTAITPASVEEALPWLWAVAARTKHPTGAFEPLESLTGSDYPGIVHPWQPEWAFQIKAHSATTIAFPSTYTSKVPPSPLLLYSQHVRFSGMNHADVPLFLDYPFVAALVPNNPAALHWHVLRTAGWADRLESTERDVIRHALRSLLNEGPVFAESTTRLLAVGLAHSVPECRALALEALLAAIDGQRLLPGALGTALGQLLAVEFFPIQRLADNLMQARAINAATDEAVSHVLGALLLELPSEPLRNTRKLLEAYADFASRAGAPVPEHVKAMLKTWNHTGATKKAIEVLVA